MPSGTQTTEDSEVTTQEISTVDFSSSEVSFPTTTYTPVSGELKVEVILTINVTPHDEINNENSVYYQELFNETFIVLTNYYSNSAATKDNFIKIVVYRISKGSLVVNHAVIMNSTSTTGQNQVAAATNNLVNGGATVKIGTVTAGVTNAAIYAPAGNATVTTSTTICGTFNTLNTCPTSQECSIDGNGVPYCAPIESTVSVPTTYTPVSGELKVEVILTINVTPHDEINNENSAYYQELFNETFIVLTNYYSNSAATKDNFIKIVVYRISKGSLVVNHAVIMNSTTRTGQNQVAAATNNLVNGGATVKIGFVTAGATNAAIYAPGGNATVTTSTTICGTFNTLNTCPTGQECSIDGNGVPYCAPIESTVSVPTTYTPVSGELKVEVILTMNVTPHDEIDYENSSYYQELFNETFIVLTNYYSNSAATKDNFIKIVVYRISKGSLVVNHAVIMNSTTTTGQNQVAAATNNLVNGGATVKIGFVTAGATNAAIYAPGGNATVTTSTTICGTFNTLNTCPTGQECSINGNGVPYCAPIESTVSFPTTTYTPVSGELKVEVILTINVTPNDEINNENSAYYQELFNETFIVLTNYYSNSAATRDNFIKIVVYRISKGSLVVNHAVIMNSTSTTGQNNVAAATNNLVNGGATLTIDNQTAGASTAAIYAPGGNATVTTSTTICGTFNTWNTCPTGQECSIDGNGVPYCAPIESTDNFPLIVGLGVGIPLFFIVLALIIVLCVYNSKRHKSISIDDDDLDRTHEGIFTGAIPGRFNSWNHPGDSAFHGRWDDESVDSERGAYDNEMFRGKDIYEYDNNKGGKPASFSWDFVFQSLPGNGQYHIKRPETNPKPNPVFSKNGGGPSTNA